MQMEMFEDFQPLKTNDWKWTMANDYPTQKNGLKVFILFACGGGSTMGYKLAGCEVLGCCEIDPRMNKVYVENHHPKYNYCEDIREFNKRDNLPEELYSLDILDASPPCTTFSMAGEREDSWGKQKKFREGQVEQTLDDLSFVAIETVKKLQPKVVIMENVEGLLNGEAWKYVQDIYAKFDERGYYVTHKLLKAEQMGVPQKRHRVFFIAFRKDLAFHPSNVELSFNYAPITFGEVKGGIPEPIKCKDGKPPSWFNLVCMATEEDACLASVLERTEGRSSRYNEMIVWDNQVSPTVHTHGFYRGNDKCKFTIEDYRNCATFPQDYNWLDQSASYITGMCVPPLMMKRVVDRVIESGIFNAKICYK